MSAELLSPVLVVDDDRDVRESLTEALSMAGYVVVAASDGAQALEALHSGLRPSLILLDLRMPVMDGEAFCERWRADPRLHRIPVVVLSADLMGEQRAKRCGANGHLKKPATLDELLATATRFSLRR